MPTLTVTAKGQITLRKELLDHLGVRPGARLHVDKLPEGGPVVRPARPDRMLPALFDSLKREGARPLDLEEIAAIAAEGWAGRRWRSRPTPTCRCAR